MIGDEESVVCVVESEVGDDESEVEVGEVESEVGIDEVEVGVDESTVGDGDGVSEDNRNSGGHAPGSATGELDCETTKDRFTGGIVPAGIVSTS